MSCICVIFFFTANELKKRLAVEPTESVPTTPSTSTAELAGNKAEKEPALAVPSDALSPSTSTGAAVRDRVAANVPSFQSSRTVQDSYCEDIPIYGHCGLDFSGDTDYVTSFLDRTLRSFTTPTIRDRVAATVPSLRMDITVPTDVLSPSTSTAPTIGDRVAANVPSVQLDIPVPTDSPSPSTSTAPTIGDRAAANVPSVQLDIPVQTDAPSPSTSTAPPIGDRVAVNVPSVQLNIPVPTDTIIAFGHFGNNEIWRRGTNKWTKWTKGRYCGVLYACVKAHSNIYILGGWSEGEDSTETDIYDISKEEWLKGPQLKVGRLDVQLFRQFLYLSPVVHECVQV